LPFVASRIYPLREGPIIPETNPYAVKTRPKIAPKCFMPKQSVTRGADTPNNVPNPKPMTAASEADKTRLFTCGKTRYAHPAAKNVRLIVKLRPTRSERYPVKKRLRPLVILKAVKITTADSKPNPLESPKAVESVTMAMPEAP